jgi:hypothetical protein
MLNPGHTCIEVLRTRNATEVVEVESAAPAALAIKTENSAVLVKDEKARIWLGSAGAFLFPRGALHQSRNHHGCRRSREYQHPAGRLNHNVAYGNACFHHS